MKKLHLITLFLAVANLVVAYYIVVAQIPNYKVLNTVDKCVIIGDYSIYGDFYSKYSCISNTMRSKTADLIPELVMLLLSGGFLFYLALSKID